VGGDLSNERLLNAYRHGIFPWYSDDQPILWWSPNPRAVLYPDALKVSRSLRKTLRRQAFSVTLNRVFDEVIEACSTPRPAQDGTWISAEIKAAYGKLHELGHAHSIECWQGDELVGGLYGIALGRVFFGESMFSRVSDASKVAFTHLVRQLNAWRFSLIDCQVNSRHLTSLGAETIPRSQFLALLDVYCTQAGRPASDWQGTLQWEEW
jgi:leucyl/phenylalanyl-tRNA--protein transferase